LSEHSDESRYRRLATLLTTWGLLAVTLGLFLLNKETFLPESWGVAAGVRNSALALVSEVFKGFYVLAVSSMSFLILRRHPSRRMGWLIAWSGLISVLTELISELSIFTNFSRPGLAGFGEAIAWLQNIAWIAPIVLYFWIFSVFPDGQLPGNRWRWVQWLVLAFALGIGAAGLIESPMHGAFSLPNPGVIDFPGREQAYGWLYGLGAMALLTATVGLALLMFFRFGRARGAERQQFKWLGFSGLIGVILLSIGLALSFETDSVVGQWLVNYAMAVLPIGVGVAVLRYRLYDIDLVIRRTLVYSVLTALLALVYFGSVVILQNFFTTLTGQQSGAAVVVSTLAIAALFFPLRNKVQDFIDRRFYRRKYDAVKLLEAFAATARDETDLDQLTARLAGVVEETMQPESTTIWLVAELTSRSTKSQVRES